MEQTGRGYSSFGAAVLSVLLLIALLYKTAPAVQGIKEGLELFTDHVLPSLLPFFVGTQLLFGSGLPQRMKLMGFIPKALLRLGAACGGVVPLCLLAGAPTGARLLATLYTDGEASRGEVARALAGATVTGPAFLIAASTAVLGSPKAGLFVYFVQLVAALVNGLLWRGMGDAPLQQPAQMRPAKEPMLVQLVRALQDACAALLPVGGAICLFSMLQTLLTAGGLPGGLSAILKSFIPAALIPPLLGGALEVSMGITAALDAAASLPLRLCVMAALASFGGLSILMQVYTFIRNAVPFGVYLMQRLSHAFFAFVLARLSLMLFPAAVAAVAPLPAVPTEALMHGAPLLLPLLLFLSLLLWPLATSSRR